MPHLAAEKPRILIVDDQPDNIAVLTNILKNQYTLMAATSGEKAIRNALQHQPDLILLDIIMPDIDGYEVCRRLKSDLRTRKIPIIFVTGMGEAEDEARGFELGAVDYIAKPFKPLVVEARIKTQMELKISRDSLEHLAAERAKQLVHCDLLSSALEEANSKLHILASTDILTGLYNRRHFNEVISVEKSRYTRYMNKDAVAFSLLFIDMDNFKYYNDTFGHHAGDLVLSEMARLIQNLLRASDTAARYGGDEFVILLPHTGGEGAIILANRIIEKLKGKNGFQEEISQLLYKPVGIREENRIGCSIGVVSYNSDLFNDLEAMQVAADRALYQAKASGKNCARCWTPDMEGLF